MTPKESDEHGNICKGGSSAKSWSRLNDPRIFRVSRAFGGKDRHSKVFTVKGLRDRRIRLSVPTAVQLYDLQERLGLNQPSKVIDWLLNATKNDIDQLPPLQFPHMPAASHGFLTMISSTASIKLPTSNFFWGSNKDEPSPATFLVDDDKNFMPHNYSFLRFDPPRLSISQNEHVAHNFNLPATLSVPSYFSSMNTEFITKHQAFQASQVSNPSLSLPVSPLFQSQNGQRNKETRSFHFQ